MPGFGAHTHMYICISELRRLRQEGQEGVQSLPRFYNKFEISPSCRRLPQQRKVSKNKNYKTDKDYHSKVK